MDVILRGEDNVYVSQIKVLLFGHNDEQDRSATLLMTNYYSINRYLPVKLKITKDNLQGFKNYYITLTNEEIIVDFDKKFPEVKNGVNDIYIKNK